MNNPKNRTTNTATRDPLYAIILACLFAVGTFAIAAMPLAWLAGEHFLHNTNTPVLVLYKAIFLHTSAFANNLHLLPVFEAIDIVFRIFVAAAASLAATWYILKDRIRTKKVEVIEAGETVSKDTDETLKRTKTKMKKADGIFIHPEIQIPKSRESEHIFIGGSTGAGKSQALSWMIDSILKRKDKALIFDIKGDYSSQLIPESAAERKSQRRFLVAPWDERSIQWHIAKDIKTDIDAEAFAQAFITSTGKESNPYFVQAAQDVLEGVLIYMLKTCGENWGWRELQVTLSNRKNIVAALAEIKHGALEHVEQDGAQTQGVMGSIRAPMKTLDKIANLWKKPSGVGIVNSFLSEKATGITLVLAAKSDMQEIATPLISGLMALMMRKGLALQDDKNRRIFFVIDELGSLPKISKLIDLITLGRSKGLCLIAGTQDLGRLESVYGKEQVQTISSQFGTHLIGRLGDSSTAKWAAELFGQQRIERLQISENQAQSYTGGLSYQPAVSTTWQQSDKAALLDSDFLHLPKATGEGFYMYARLTDDTGAALLGKIKYPINPVPSPFPACIEKSGSGTGSTGGSGASQRQKPEQAEEKRKAQAQIEEDHLEELEAIITSNTPAPDSVREKGEDSGSELAEKAAEEIGLHALGIDGGLNVAIDVAEELLGNGGTTNSSTSSTQSHSTKKKRRKRLSKSALEI